MSGKAESGKVKAGSVAKRIGIVVTGSWHRIITDRLLEGALKELKSAGVEEVPVLEVPGSLELVYGVRLLATQKEPEGVIILGCVIKGETDHYEYVCRGVLQGLMELNIRLRIPVVSGLLTVDTPGQALVRSEGENHKGEEAARAVLAMVRAREGECYRQEK
jgi:6,7-dimethyl-8-ribityllumazine synthase